MLSSHPKVCVVWMRSGTSLDSELGVSQSPPTGLLPGVTTAGALPLCWNPKKEPAVLLSCCYKKAGLLIKSEPDLRGNGRGIYTLVPADIWELPSSGCNWAFSHLSLPGSLLVWEPEFLGPKYSLTYLQLRVSNTPHGSVSHLLDDGYWTCSRTLVPDWSSVPISGQVAQRWVLLRMLWWAGGCNCLVMFMGPGIRTVSGRPLGTQLLGHRGP